MDLPGQINEGHMLKTSVLSDACFNSSPYCVSWSQNVQEWKLIQNSDPWVGMSETVGASWYPSLFMQPFRTSSLGFPKE